jgi:hypothetical protein
MMRENGGADILDKIISSKHARNSYFIDYAGLKQHRIQDAV